AEESPPQAPGPEGTRRPTPATSPDLATRRNLRRPSGTGSTTSTATCPCNLAIDTAAASPNARLSCPGRAESLELTKYQDRSRRLLVCSIPPPTTCREYPQPGSREEVFPSAEARPLAAD